MGLSEYARNGIVNGVFTNAPFVVPVVAASLHNGNPGDEGTNAAATLVSADSDRAQITSAAADGGTAASTGDPATWHITEAGTITYLGLHDAFSGGNWLGMTPVDQPTQVADGDTVTLSTFSGTLS